MGTGTSFSASCRYGDRHVVLCPNPPTRLDVDMGTGTEFVVCAERPPYLMQGFMNGRGRRRWRAGATTDSFRVPA